VQCRHRSGEEGGRADVSCTGRRDDERIDACGRERDGANKACRPAAYDGYFGGYGGRVYHWPFQLPDGLCS
jgi:hypothetical protein